MDQLGFSSLLSTVAIPLVFVCGLNVNSPVYAQDEAVLPTEDDLRTALAQIVSENIDYLDLRYIEPNSSNTNSGYLLGYDWSWDRANTSFNTDENIVTALDYNFSFFAKGTHAFQDTTNPENLSEAGVSLGLTRVSLGQIEKRLSRTQSDDFQQCLAGLDPLDTNYNQSSRQCAADHGVFDILQANRANNWIYGVELEAKLEANADYTQKQQVIGLEAFASVRPHSESILSDLNVFDYPFRVMRGIFSTSEENFVPSWPIFRVGIQTIDIEANDPRRAVAPADDRFERVFGEVAFNTVLASVNQGSIKSNFSYQVYRELGASQMIKAANLDEFEYFTASLQFPAGLVTPLVPQDSSFYISYSEGELPFDRESTRAFSIGWQTNLNLSALLGN